MQQSRFTARSLGVSIFTEGDNIDELKKNIRDAVKCHFGKAEDAPRIIRLHFLKEEVMAV